MKHPTPILRYISYPYPYWNVSGLYRAPASREWVGRMEEVSWKQS